MGIPKDQLQLIERAAVATVKSHLRAEAKAQATIAKKEIADQFNKVLDQMNGTISNLAESNARLIVITEVLTDFLVKGDHKDFSGLSEEDRRLKLQKLFSDKGRELEAGIPS